MAAVLDDSTHPRNADVPSSAIGYGPWCCGLLLLTFLSGCGTKTESDPGLTSRELKTDADRLSVARFSQDGQRLAVGGAGGVTVVWKNLDDPPVVLRSENRSPLVQLLWAPEDLLLTVQLARGLTGWQFGKSEPSHVELSSLPSAIVCLAIRPKSKSAEMVLGMRDGSLVFVDSNGLRQVKPDHRGSVKQAVYSLDGQTLITAGADGQLIWRDAASHKITQAEKPHDAEISRLLLSADGKHLVSGDWNGRLVISEMATRVAMRKLVQPDAVSGLGWVGAELVSGSWDGALRGWDLTSGQCVRTHPTGAPIHDLTADSKSRRVATVSLTRFVRVWDWPAQ
jgi:WD40 repeat protein